MRDKANLQLKVQIRSVADNSWNCEADILLHEGLSQLYRLA